MTRVVLDLDLGRDAPELVADDADPPPSAQFDDLVDWWVRRVLAPFEHRGGGEASGRVRTLEVSTELLGDQVNFIVRLNEDLLEDLVAAYSVCGWEGVEAVTTAVGSRGADDPVRDFVAGTQRVAATMVLRGLTRLEEFATGFAKDRWQQSRATLQGYREQFRMVGSQSMHPEFKTHAVEEQVIALCRRYAAASDDAVRLGKLVASRKKGRYQSPGTGDYLWFELYAEPQRSALDTMNSAFAEIVKTFPAAALGLDDLPKELHPGNLNASYARVTLASHIYGRVSGLLDDVGGLLRTLSKPAGTTRLITPQAGQQRATLRTTRGGVEQQLVDLVLRSRETDRRVMANPGLLADLDDPDVKDSPLETGSWEGIVLRQYRVRLARAIEDQRQTSARWERFWQWLGRIAALLSLLALLAVFPFGAGTVAPALGMALAIAGFSATALGLITLIVYDILGSLAKAGKLEADARDQLFRLAQRDPDALREIGAMLSESATVRAQLGEGLLAMLLSIGVARFKPIARALEMKGFLDDIETLFAPPVTSE